MSIPEVFVSTPSMCTKNVILYLSYPAGITADHEIPRDVESALEIERLLLGGVFHNLPQIGDEGSEIEFDTFEAQLARLHLGKVQDVVDNHEQGLRTHLNGFGSIPLVIVQTRVQHEVSQSDDSSDGSTDLVAHVCEELTLHLILFLGKLLLCRQSGVGDFENRSHLLVGRVDGATDDSGDGTFLHTFCIGVGKLWDDPNLTLLAKMLGGRCEMELPCANHQISHTRPRHSVFYPAKHPQSLEPVLLCSSRGPTKVRRSLGHSEACSHCESVARRG